MKYLVTGGAGFIGSHLVNHLVESGAEVCVLDNFFSGFKSNIQHVIDQKKIQLIEGDVADKETCKQATKGVDVVFHMAAHVSVQESLEKPHITHHTNVDGTFCLLNACVQNGVRRLINTSSSAVYGDLETMPLLETYDTAPKSLYGMTKLFQEHYARLFHEAYGLETISLRYFNVFGPRQSPHSDYAAVIPAFLKQVFKGEAPVIYGDGHQTRDFVFVDDIVSANMLAARAKKAVGQTYNVGSGNKISILELANEIIKLSRSNVKPVFSESRKGDIVHSFCSISKIEKELGWKPAHRFSDGLNSTAEWMKKNLKS